MIKTIESQGERTRNRLYKHPVKLTALLYLKEALAKEKYELCPELNAFLADELDTGREERLVRGVNPCFSFRTRCHSLSEVGLDPLSDGECHGRSFAPPL